MSKFTLVIFHHLEKNKKTGKMGKSRLHSDCLLPWGEEQKWKDSRVKSSWASDSLQRARVCSAAELPLAASTGALASRCILLRSDDRIQNIAFSVFDYRCVKSVVDYSLLLHLSTYCIFTPLLSPCSSSTHSVYLAVFQSLKVKSLVCIVLSLLLLKNKIKNAFSFTRSQM